MPHSLKKSLFVTALFISLFLPKLAEAKITVQPDFEGTLLVTFPDGKVQMYDAGETLPEIPNGASIEVFGGKISVSTGDGESLKLSCLGSEAAMGGGSSATMGCGETDGKLNVVTGSAQVAQLNGTPKTIGEGQEYAITSTEGTEENEPATAEGESLGTTPPPVNPPDSRSMETSPSQ